MCGLMCTLYLGPVPEHPYCMCVDACTLAQYRPSTGTPILHVCGCMYLGPVPEHPYCMCVDASTLAQYRNTHTACVWVHVPWPSTGTPILHVWVHVPWPSTGTPILHVCGCMYLGPVPEHPYCMCGCMYLGPVPEHDTQLQCPRVNAGIGCQQSG